MFILVSYFCVNVPFNPDLSGTQKEKSRKNYGNKLPAKNKKNKVRKSKEKI